jgi:hypothetical protein
MPAASNAKIQYEAGQTPVPMTALTDAGNAIRFTAAGSPWSRRTGFAPVVRPDGLITGGTISPAVSGTNDKVDVAAGTGYIGGALVSWSAATDVAITRGLTTDIHCTTSITVTSAGAVVPVAGVDHTTTSEVRAANGGPPLIPVTSIEIGQVRTTTVTAAAVATTEIYQVPGTHQERFDTPVMVAQEDFAGAITFATALPKIHTGTLPKRVYASYATPSFADVPKGLDYVPPEVTYSVGSTQYYGGTEGSVTSSLGQGSFTAMLDNGVTDSLIGLSGENLWFRFYPDRARTMNIMAQGVLGIARTFPVGSAIQAKCTINSNAAAAMVA